MILLGPVASLVPGQLGSESRIVRIFHRSMVNAGPGRDHVQDQNQDHNGDGNPGDSTPADVGYPHSDGFRTQLKRTISQHFLPEGTRYPGA